MYLQNFNTDNEIETIIMQMPGDGDGWDDEEEDEGEGWDDIEDEDYEDELNDKNDLYETEISENDFDEEDDDHFPEDDEF
jgi:hypothetical protein